LTFNAHKIHLDRQYCREVEGYRDLLVHGPLLLIMMFSVLNRNGLVVNDLTYRNLAPVYVNEMVNVCLAERRAGTWDVWIAGHLDDSIRVKGTATVEKRAEAIQQKEAALIVGRARPRSARNPSTNVEGDPSSDPSTENLDRQTVNSSISSERRQHADVGKRHSSKTPPQRRISTERQQRLVQVLKASSASRISEHRLPDLTGPDSGQSRSPLPVEPLVKTQITPTVVDKSKSRGVLRDKSVLWHAWKVSMAPHGKLTPEPATETESFEVINEGEKAWQKTAEKLQSSQALAEDASKASSDAHVTRLRELSQFLASLVSGKGGK